MCGERLDDRVEVAGDREGRLRRRRPQLARPRERAQLLEVDRVGELDRDLAARLAEQVGDPLDRDQPPVADDPDPVADALRPRRARARRGRRRSRARAPRRPGPGTPPASAGRARWSARRGSAARVDGRWRGSGRPSGGCRARAGPGGGRDRRGSARPAPRRGRARRCRAGARAAAAPRARWSACRSRSRPGRLPSRARIATLSRRLSSPKMRALPLLG